MCVLKMCMYSPDNLTLSNVKLGNKYSKIMVGSVSMY